ncbi:class I SAM-dependent methyltransferase [Paenibacillus sp. V4I7]|uniref:class I SAM-dependent methyltransferase n=1 Tax=Paenibacillus sp. V4I7 TaxID=3042307 RepID=UPI002781467D|nr:methyltransferase domain-containing protein [Paenibacillus sp. V4I7]MDQ0898062.1 ubiquinone/menaquinone biosynthesis C-methylase UbiE [Paenibacillus sp. V4I7]
MKPLETKRFIDIRSELINKAKGEVLEIGSGTGINFSFYKDVSVTAIEPNPVLRKASYERAYEAKMPIHVIEGNAEQLPFADHSFDTVVGTLVLCTIPNPVKAIREISRVCKPTGTILLFEHIRHENSLLGKIQDLLTPIWKRACDGCHLNRDTIHLLRQEELEIIDIKKHVGNIFITVEARKKQK